MKRRPLVQTLSVLCGLMFALGLSAAHHEEAGSVARIKEEGRQLMEALSEYSAGQKTKAMALVDKNLDRLDARIDSLEDKLASKWSEMSEEARAETRAKLKALKAERIKVAEWYGSLKSDTGAAWGKLKQGFSDAYGDLTKAWKAAEEEF